MRAQSKIHRRGRDSAQARPHRGAQKPNGEQLRAATARARFGNAGTSALLAERVQILRPKLEVGSVSDPLEREADATADKVVRMKAGGDCAACARGDSCDGGAKVRRSAGSGGGAAMPLAPAAEASVRRATSGGEPLPATVRASMEPRFGADFGSVRVHRDAAAADSARGIGARAYTVGNHIAFGAGQWAPGTDRGDRLIAHELTHTLQDGGGAARTVRGDFLDDLGDAAGAVVDAASEAVGDAAGAVAGAARDVYDTVAEVVGQGIDGAAEVAGAVGEAAEDAVGAVAGAVGGTAEAASDAAAELARRKLLGQVAGARARLAGVPSEALIPEGPQLAALNGQVASLGRVSSMVAAPALPALGALATLIGQFLAWLAAAIAALTLSEILIILAIIAAIILIILWFVDTSKTKPITIAPPITVPVPETPPNPEKDKKKGPKKDPKTEDPPPPPLADDCVMQFGLLPFINARRLEQRGPINNEITVDRALFRLDAGISPPPGQDTTAGSRAFARRIGCPPDDAGHVIAKRFGGQASFNSSNGNIYPQDPAFNRGQMNQTDRVINDLHRSGRDVCSLIQLSYTPADSLRPTHATYFFMFRSPGQLRFSPLISTVQRNESTDVNCQA